MAKLDPIIAHIRKTPGLSSKIARTCRIAPQAVSQWRKVPLERIAKVAELTGWPATKIRPDIAQQFQG